MRFISMKDILIKIHPVAETESRPDKDEEGYAQ